MNKLIIYADERKMENSETKTKVIIHINNATHEIYLNKESIDKLVKSDKFVIETKTFTDKSTLFWLIIAEYPDITPVSSIVLTLLKQVDAESPTCFESSRFVNCAFFCNTESILYSI